MKSTHIILLCIILLIQGISQAYAAQMMSANATESIELTSTMPCHSMTNNAAMTMDDCCDQDCQCQMMASAMVMTGKLIDHQPDTYVFMISNSSALTSLVISLYRPPIFA